MHPDIFGAVDHYIGHLFPLSDPALEAALDSIRREGIPSISVSPNQGRFLHLLARMINARRILEIGTLAGYSTIWMARALPADGKLISLEYEPLHARVATENLQRAGLADKVEIRVGKAIDLLPALKAEGQEPFDLIFIDADKPPYKEYFDHSLALSRSGTVIIADNVIREGKVLDSSSADEMVRGVQRFNQALAACSRVTASIIQTVGAKEHDGMALALVN